MVHSEQHRSDRIGWLRAAVLGANDGIVSTASLIVGVATAGASRGTVLTAGLAGMVGGAMSMATGEYVSVSSQADTEQADLQREQGELLADPASELKELAGIYERRGLDPDLALEVAGQLTAHDALAAHSRDELGITDLARARPLQAAASSAVTFTAGAALPLLAAVVASERWRLAVVVVAALIGLAVLGSVSARAGGAPRGRAIVRITMWSSAAFAATAFIGALVGAAT